MSEITVTFRLLPTEHDLACTFHAKTPREFLVTVLDLITGYQLPDTFTIQSLAAPGRERLGDSWRTIAVLNVSDIEVVAEVIDERASTWLVHAQTELMAWRRRNQRAINRRTRRLGG